MKRHLWAAWPGGGYSTNLQAGSIILIISRPCNPSTCHLLNTISWLVRIKFSRWQVDGLKCISFKFQQVANWWIAGSSDPAWRLDTRLRLSDELCSFHISDTQNLKFEIAAILLRFFVKLLAHIGVKRGPHWKRFQKKKTSAMESYHSTLPVPW